VIGRDAAGTLAGLPAMCESEMPMRSAGNFGVLLGLLGLVGACNGSQAERQQQVQRELAVLRQDLLAINRTLDANRARADRQIQEESKGRASLTAQFQELATEVRLAQGRLEESARSGREISRRMEAMGDRLDETLKRMSALSTQVVSLEGLILAQQERMDQLTKGPGPGATSGAPGGTPAASLGLRRPAESPGGRASAAERFDAARLAAEGADALYRSALTEFTRQNFDQAVQGFQTFAQSFPQDVRAADASYWLAESLRGQGSYGGAAKAFEDFLRSHPDSPKFATAQVRHGEALLLSGDKVAGCAALERAQSQHPRTRAGALAKELLGQYCRPS
jgi:tol-pal system protein YbgF